MNMEEAFKLLNLKDEELRKIYLDAIEENAKLKKEVENLKELLGGSVTKRYYETKTTKEGLK